MYKKGYNSKRVEAMYTIFEQRLRNVKLAESGEEKVRIFLESIEFQDADELIVEALENMDSKLEVAKVLDFHVGVTMSKLNELSNSTYGWNEYFDIIIYSYKKWKYSQEMKEKFGCGLTDMIRLYLYCVTH